jgi:hypothetical protein
MPTLVQVRNAVDARLTALWTGQVVPRQAQYASNHGGRFFQGYLTFVLSALPNNPSNASPTLLEVVPVLDTHPTDQAFTWLDAGLNLEATIPMALQMDVYDGSLGKGYVGTVWGRWNGNLYTRSQNNGPEVWRSQPWALVS